MFDESVMQAVAVALAPKVMQWDPEGEYEQTELVCDLVKAFDNAFDWDAYKLARALDDAGWEVDSSLVDVLDAAASHAYQARDKAIREWVKANDIRPAFKVGDKVQTKRRYNGFEGEITRIDEELGRYLVFSEARGHVRTGQGTHGTYMDFEDAEEMQHAGGNQCGGG
jgi:hypothetical protein